MSTNKHSVTISEATTQKQRSTVRQGMKLRQAPLPKEKTIYFDVGIYTVSETDIPEPVEKLQAGETYLLAITCEKSLSLINTIAKQQDGKPISGPFSLILSYTYDCTITDPITPAREIFSFEAIFPEQFIYEFTLPAEFPTCRVTIKLQLRTLPRGLPTLVTTCTLPVCGQQKKLELEIFTVSQINQRLPERTAILLIETTGQRLANKQHIRLRGWSETGQQLDDIAHMNVIVSIEELQAYRQRKKEDALGADAFLKRLTHFSRTTSRELLRWLHSLLEKYQEPFNLIIVDLTDREIPWELLEITSDLYPGICARIARWLPTQYFTMQRELSIEPIGYEGSVISYLDEHLGSELIHKEYDALQHLAGEPYSSLAELKKRLVDSLEEVGLIYIGCHGTRGQHLLQQNVPELSSIMLEGIYACKIPQITVFLNACESARITKKKP